MKAARITTLGKAPELGEVQEPTPGPDDAVIELVAAGVNPVDIAVSLGIFYAGHPPVPYTPCLEAVGRVISGPNAGSLAYASGGGLGVSKDGMAVERFAFPAALLQPIPEGTDAAVAVSLGVAGLAGWLPLSLRAGLKEGETVLVLGATGAAGTIAVQAARFLGAGRVVAAGRNADRLAALGDLVDATVDLSADDNAARLVEACGEGADVVYDALWGPPLVAALGATKVGARVIQLGSSAGQTAEVPSAAVRGKQLNILGYSTFGVPRETIAATYKTLLEHANAGRLRIEVTRVPLADAAAAWDGQRAGDGKFVLVP